MPPLSKNVKVFIAACVVIFLIQTFASGVLEGILGFVPSRFASGFLWQMITYIFLHDGLFHLLMNMFVFAMFGAELERLWGPKFFMIYFFGCGIGSILIYFLITILFITSSMETAVVGASGGIYGLLLAYGIIFPERQLLFMFLFPMPAKYFVMLIGAIELYTTLTQSGGKVANLVHLTGILVGYLILVWESKKRNRKKGPGGKSGGGFFKKNPKRHLKIVINND